MLDMEFVDSSVLLDIPTEGTVPPPSDTIEKQQPLNDKPGDPNKKPEGVPKFWSFTFYQQYFDVTTIEVISRIRSGARPFSTGDFLESTIQNKPDLYGPIWISATLVLLLVISSRMAYFFEDQPFDHNWRSTLNGIYSISMVVFLYYWCLPALIWMVLEWYPITEAKFSLAELFCLYGYGSSVFLLVIVIWALPLPITRWISSVVAIFVSGVGICRGLKSGFFNLDRTSYFMIQSLLFFLNAMIWVSFIMILYPVGLGASNILDASATSVAVDSLVSIVHPSHQYATSHHSNASSLNLTEGSIFSESM